MDSFSKHFLPKAESKASNESASAPALATEAAKVIDTPKVEEPKIEKSEVSDVSDVKLEEVKEESKPSAEESDSAVKTEEKEGEKAPEVSDKEEKPKEPEAKPPEKLFKLKVGDQDMELPSSALLDVSTKGGKEAKITLEEAKSDYWGKQEISRRMSEIDRTAKDQKSALDFVRELNDVSSKSQGADKVDAVLAQLVRANPTLQTDMVEYHKKLYQDLINVAQLSDPDREKYFMQQEIENLRNSRKMEDDLQNRRALESYVHGRESEIKNKYKIEPRDLVNMGEQVRASFGQQGLLDRLTIPELYNQIEVRIVKQSHMDTAFEMIRALAPDKAEQMVKNQAYINYDDPSDPNVKELRELFLNIDANPSLVNNKSELRKRAEVILGVSGIEKEANEKVRQHEKATGHKIVDKPNNENKILTKDKPLKKTVLARDLFKK